MKKKQKILKKLIASRRQIKSEKGKVLRSLKDLRKKTAIPAVFSNN